jgi:ankyrin repeat protein
LPNNRAIYLLLIKKLNPQFIRNLFAFRHLAMDQALMMNFNPSSNARQSIAWQMTKATVDNSLVFVKYLVDQQGVDVNGADYNGFAPDAECRYWAENLRAPVIVAATLERFEIAIYLIERGARVDARTPTSHETLLHKAAEKGNFAFLNHVLKLPGIEIDPLDSRMETPAVKATRFNHLSAVEALIRHGASENIPLPVAVAMGRTAIVRLLLETGADPEQIGQGGRPLLYVAATQGNESVVEVLLEAGAHEDPVTRAYCPAMTAATTQGSHHIVQRLLSRGWSPDGDGLDRDHLPPLHTALKYGYTIVATILINNGADVNMLDADGIPVVFYAAELGNVEILTLLQSRGADLNININGVTAQQKAAERGRREAVRFFRRAGRRSPDAH